MFGNIPPAQRRDPEPDRERLCARSGARVDYGAGPRNLDRSPRGGPGSRVSPPAASHAKRSACLALAVILTGAPACNNVISTAIRHARSRLRLATGSRHPQAPRWTGPKRRTAPPRSPVRRHGGRTRRVAPLAEGVRNGPGSGRGGTPPPTRGGGGFALLCALWAALAAGCGPGGGDGGASGSAPIRLVDDAGSEIELSAPPLRILSLVPSATEILLALGQEARLVGRTDYDTEDPVAHLPSVGGGLRPSIERIVALDPDLVVRFRAESDPATPRRLDASGIAHAAIRPDRIGDIGRIIRLLGTAVGEEARADSLRRATERDLDRASREGGRRRPVRVALLVGGDPPTVAGPATFLSELLSAAGGSNAFPDLGELYAPISLEEILVREPDLILAPEGTPLPGPLAHIPLREFPLRVLTPGLQLGASVRLLSALLDPAGEG